MDLPRANQFRCGATLCCARCWTTIRTASRLTHVRRSWRISVAEGGLGRAVLLQMESEEDPLAAADGDGAEAEHRRLTFRRVSPCMSVCSMGWRSLRRVDNRVSDRR